MRPLLAIALLALPAAAEHSAADYFELGLDYLRKGLFRPARAAFSESLVRSPGQPVPMAFAAVAGMAEGRPAAESALLLRWAYRQVPPDRTLRLDLARHLPSSRTLDLLRREHARLLENEPGTARLARLTVLAFLEAQDGDASDAPHLDALLEEHPDDPFAKALARLRPPAAPAP